MLAIYLGILAIGIVAIILILASENKNSKSSAVDLLNSLDIDESSSEEKKEQDPSKIHSSDFLNRLNLDEEKIRKSEPPEAIEPNEKPAKIQPAEPVKAEPEPTPEPIKNPEPPANTQTEKEPETPKEN
jgi:outer membrane biosynthesis protein TonB